MNIFIVGPMGSGKTTVGKIVAGELFLDFHDTDAKLKIAQVSQLIGYLI
jgi:shikimate kinase